MLTNVESIVGSVDDVCVIQLVACLQAFDQRFYQFIYTLQRPQTRPVEVVITVDDRLVLLGQIANPTDSARLVQG